MRKVSEVRQLLVVVACILDFDDSTAGRDVGQEGRSGLKVLLVQRREPQQKEINLMWELPGGKVDFGETGEQAIVREVWEETGYRVEAVGALPFSYATVWQYENFTQHTVIYCYECKVRELPKEHPKKDHKIAQLKWSPFDEVDFSHVLAGSREFIWHIASKYSVPLATRVPQIAYAHFSLVDPTSNKNKYYSIMLQITPGMDQPYVVTTRHGRLGYRGPGKLIVKEFSSDEEVRKKIRELLQERRRHGYAVNSYSDNFPCRTLLEQFPTPSGQLTLWSTTE